MNGSVALEKLADHRRDNTNDISKKFEQDALYEAAAIIRNPKPPDGKSLAEREEELVEECAEVADKSHFDKLGCGDKIRAKLGVK